MNLQEKRFILQNFCTYLYSAVHRKFIAGPKIGTECWLCVITLLLIMLPFITILYFCFMFTTSSPASVIYVNHRNNTTLHSQQSFLSIPKHSDSVLTVTEKMFQTKYIQRRAALHRTVTVARHRVGSARSFATSFFSDSRYLYKYHS